MARQSSTITLPKWIKEISPEPEKYLKGILKTLAFLKMKEYERQMQVFEKIQNLFSSIWEKIKTSKKEDFNLWDDYLVWKELYQAYQKWQERTK